MIKNLLMIASGIGCGLLFVWIRGKIKSIVKSTIKGESEPFSWAKFWGGFSALGSAKDWAKDIVSLFNVRKLIIYSIILATIFGYGYWKGIRNKPVFFDLRGKRVTIKLNEHYLKIDKDGTANIIDKKGNVLKKIRVSDIPALQKALKPYGFVFEPIAVGGIGVGESGAGFEGGAGVSILKWYKWKADTFLTNRGIYLGTHYQITDNSGVGVGAGKGYEGDNRILGYFCLKW